jgi:hypothetical protein
MVIAGIFKNLSVKWTNDQVGVKKLRVIDVGIDQLSGIRPVVVASPPRSAKRVGFATACHKRWT